MLHESCCRIRRPATPTGIVALVLVGFLFAPTAQAEGQGRLNVFGHHYSLVAGASMFVPRDPTIRSIYGERTFSPAVTIWNFDTPAGLGLSWDLGKRKMDEGDRRADSLRAGVGPRLSFASNRADVAPYVTVRGDVYVMRFDEGSWQAKPGFNVELGASLLRHAVISGRYDSVRRVGGFDLSGFSARAAVKVY